MKNESKIKIDVWPEPDIAGVVWHDFIFNKAQIKFLRGRLKFELNGESKDAAPFPSALVIYGESKNKYDDLPVIPKFVADYIRLMKLEGKSLGDAIKYWLREDDIDEYMEDNSETFARAWLNGYQVEAQHDTRTD